MTSRAKLNTSVLVTGGMIWLNILSYPLGFSSGFQLVLNGVTMIPIALNFVFLRQVRSETEREVAAGRLSPERVAASRRHARQRLIILWILLVPFVVSFPLWLPRATGVSVGPTGDYLVSLATLALISVVFWAMVRRLDRP